MTKTIRDEVRSFIINRFLFGDGEKIADSTSLLEQHVVDSTGVMEIVAFIEKTFGIQVEDYELIPENLDSIEEISKFVAMKRSG